MTDVTICPVRCLNCSKSAIFRSDDGFHCETCYHELSIDEYFATVFSAQFAIYSDSGLGNIVRGRKDGEKYGDFHCVDSLLNMSTQAQFSTKPIIDLAKELGLGLNISVSSEEVYSSNCIVCGGSLSYLSHQFPYPAIGCISQEHTYYYTNPLFWVSTSLNKQYEKFRFGINAQSNAIAITKTETIPAEKPTFAEKWNGVSKLPQTKKVTLLSEIQFRTKESNLVIWVPQPLMVEIGDIVGFLNSLNIHRVKAVPINK